MTRSLHILPVILCLSLLGAAPASKGRMPLASDTVIDRSERMPLSAFAQDGRWNTPFAPFTIIDNIHYVGTAGISAYLITSPAGHILIDGSVPQSVPLITANVKALGFQMRDVKILLNSHAHFDHAGGLAGLQRASGAIFMASAGDKPFLESGDIGHGPSGGMKFPPIRVDRLVRDGDIVSVGRIKLTAHLTPGHSPGCTSWSTTATGTDKVRRHVFFHCGTSVAGQSLDPAAYPGIVANFQTTFAKLRTYKADIFLANHDNFFDLTGKRARQIAGEGNAFVDASELSRFNETMEIAFTRELNQARTAQKETAK